MTKGATNSSQKNDPVEVQKFPLNDVKGPVTTTQKVTILPFGTVNVQAKTSVKGHCMRVHVLTELALSPQLPASVVSTATYRELHPGSSRVPVCLHNLSACAIKVPTKTIIGQIVSVIRYLWWSTQPGLLQRQNTQHKKDECWRLYTSKALLSGLSQSRSRPGSCCSNGSTCLHTVTWIWAKLL